MRFILVFFAVLFLGTVAATAQTMDTVAKQAIVMDYETGQVLYSKNADERMPTSSMSKTLTGYVVFQALKDGKLTLDQELPVSEKAWRMQGSKMFVPIHGMVKVEDLIRGMLIQSGNDATIVLAEGLAGSEDAFVEAMNRTAQRLGMKDSHFANASGWPDPNHYSTAHDLAILAAAVIHDFPDYYKYDSEKEFTYNGIKQGNRNPLLYRDIGADGVKTGHTDIGGYGLTGSGVRNGRRVIVVLNGMASMQERADEGARLLDWALASFTNVDLFHDGQQVATAPVVMGMEQSVPLIVEKGMKVTLPKMAGSNIKRVAIFNAPLEAPVKKGQKVGIVRISVPNMTDIELPLMAGADVDRLGFFPSLIEKTRRLILGDHVALPEGATVSEASNITPAAQPAPAPTPAPAATAPAPQPVQQPAADQAGGDME